MPNSLSVVPTADKEIKHELVSKSFPRAVALSISYRPAPKCRFRIPEGNAGKEVCRQIWILSEQLKIQPVELNVQTEHVHLQVRIAPKLSVSEVMGELKGRTAIRLFSKFPYRRRHKLWGNHVCAKGYCVDTPGVNAEMLSKYVKPQESTNMMKSNNRDMKCEARALRVRAKYARMGRN